MGNENLKESNELENINNQKRFENKKKVVKYPKRMKDIIEQKKNKESSTSQSESETEDENQDRTIFIFEWKENNKKVTITGDFLNWVHFILMKKDKKTNHFKLKINLPKKRNEFKFIVDGEWKCSNDYPQFKNDHGIYNYIDLSINENKKEEKKEKEIKKNKKKNDLNFNCYKPLKSEMNVDAPDLPRYFSLYNIDYNTRQNKIGNQKLLIFKENNLLSENNSYKKILTCPHVNLSHCCTQVNKDNNANIITSITFRFQHKFLTIIYYKPEFI
jgi:hypothetical protein